MGESEESPAPATVLPVVFTDGEESVDLGTVTLQPSLDVRKLHAVIADRVGVAPQQIAASLARRGRARRVPLDESAGLAAAREGDGSYIVAVLRRSRRERRGGRSRRDKKKAAAGGPAPQAPEKTILKRMPTPDLSSLAARPSPAPMVFGAWGYEAQLLELQRQREWYLMHAAADSYGPFASPEPEIPPLWSPRPPRQEPAYPCHECEAAVAEMRAPSFHWCVRDAVTVGFRSPVGPIERPAKKSLSPPPAASTGRASPFLGVPVYLSSC